MDFGKLTDLSGVDFRLPPDHPGTFVTLGGVPSPAGFSVFHGGTGWGNPSWVGKWYPGNAKQKDFLHHYARQFNTIELNTTHYRIPETNTIRQWRESVPDGFLFCPKVPQVISHRRRLHQAERDVLAFCASISGLEEKLGPSFLQLPPDFGLDMLPRLRQFLASWPDEIPLMVEFRHPAWFGGLPKAEEAFDLLAHYGFGTVITDVAGRRDVLHQHLTNATLMLRFVGNLLHPTDFTRFTDWAIRISQWRAQGLERAILFLHQPDNERMPDFAEKIIPVLNEKLGMEIALPKRYEIAQQGSLF